MKRKIQVECFSLIHHSALCLLTFLRYLFLLPPLEALFLPAPEADLPAPLFLAPPLEAAPLFLPPLFFAPPRALAVLLDLDEEVADEATREAVRVAVRAVFSAALAERFATLLAARVCLRTCLVFSLAARFTASLTPRPEELEPRDLPPLEPDESLGRIMSAAVGLTMPTMLAAESIMLVATFEA
jgi:hypothetical protein